MHLAKKKIVQNEQFHPLTSKNQQSVKTGRLRYPKIHILYSKCYKTKRNSKVCSIHRNKKTQQSIPEGSQIKDQPVKDFKSTILNMLSEIKESMEEELKEIGINV